MGVSVKYLGIVLVLAIIAVIVIVIAALASKSKKDKAENTGEGSYFDGGYLAYIGYGFLVGFVSIITFGIAFPWMCCVLQRWKARHTVICGKRQVFDGKGVQLIGRFILWSFLTVITFGIYSLWMAVAVKKWITKHTHFVGEEDDNSYFDGGVLGFFGTNILASIVMLVPFVGFAWSNVIKLRWKTEHTVIDSRRLVFTGTIGTFFLKYFVWGILSVITLGIFALFVPVKNLRLETENTIDNEHTNKALMEQSEYRNRVHNTVSANKNANTEFEMENLRAGINDTTEESALLEAAQRGLRSAQYLYAIKFANGDYTTEIISSLLKASAQAGYAPAMCLYALTHELDEAYKYELLEKAAENGQIKAIKECMLKYANTALAQGDSKETLSLLEKAVFFGDVLLASGEELDEQENKLLTLCVLKIRKIKSAQKTSSKGKTGAIVVIVMVCAVAIIFFVAAIFGLLFRAVPSTRNDLPAMETVNSTMVAE